MINGIANKKEGKGFCVKYLKTEKIFK